VGNRLAALADRALFAANALRLKAALAFAACAPLLDITVLSNAIRTVVFANAFDMNVSTCGSLLLRLSHHRNGLSTHPPSKLGTLPSKLPRYPPNRSTSLCSL